MMHVFWWERGASSKLCMHYMQSWRLSFGLCTALLSSRRRLFFSSLVVVRWSRWWPLWASGWCLQIFSVSSIPDNLVRSAYFYPFDISYVSSVLLVWISELFKLIYCWNKSDLLFVFILFHCISLRNRYRKVVIGWTAPKHQNRW